jgi:diaminohydroxyphosphoribosylaminopyrimidine deaminase/5-amino-6-(5-phosphoribosylamino)uracil reductase
MNYEPLMERAIRLARKAEGHTGHYPMVGAVLLKNNKIIAEGYFKHPGEPHAERKAILAAGRNAAGATLILNLEPCCHFGRTPPCTDIVISSGIKKVVAGMTDPNPLVSGKGFRKLRTAGIKVVNHVLEKECRVLNRHFIKFMTTRTPWVIEKLAATADGRLADRWGNSKWISSEESRALVHKLRSHVQVVMVGIGTVLQDDPKLTARTPGASHQPRPLIVDERLQIPLSAKVLKTPAQGGAIIACTDSASAIKRDRLERLGATVVVTRPDKNKQVNLKELMKKLGAMNIASLLIEGGSHLAGAMLEQDLVDEVMYFYAPKLLADGKALPMLSGALPRKITNPIALCEPAMKKSGPDFVLNAYLREI